MADILTDYLDFKNIYFNELIGDVNLAIVIGAIIILVLCLKFDFDWEVIILTEMLWLSIIYATITGMLILWVIVVLIATILFAHGLSAKVLK